MYVCHQAQPAEGRPGPSDYYGDDGDGEGGDGDDHIIMKD